MIDLSTLVSDPAIPEVRGPSSPPIKFLLDPGDREWIGEGGCWICGTPKALAVDHDHEAGYVRGFLCRGCNIGLGCFADRPERLHRAADYLVTAASRAFADLCECGRLNGPKWLVVDPADRRRLRTQAVYQCACGVAWPCWWATDAWLATQGLEVRRQLNGTR